MSLDFVVQTLGTIHPQNVVHSTRGRERDGSYIVVPSARNPALVLPTNAKAGAATACRLYSESRGWAHTRSELLAAAFSLGIGERIFRDRMVLDGPGVGGLDYMLGELLREDVRLAFAVGKARANRKPVLLALNVHGRVRAFVKLGVNPLTDALVTHEAEALKSLAHVDLGVVRIPFVRHFGDWGGHPLLVLDPLPVDKPRAADPAPLLQRAMVDVATSGQAPCSSALWDLPWWSTTIAAVQGLPESSNARRLQAVIDQLGIDAISVPCGAWHGDWNPGNAAVLGEQVLVWDWERFATGVPLGWDALHRALVELAPRGVPPSREALSGWLNRSPHLLRPFGVGHEHADLVATLYLLELAARLVSDDQRALGVAMGAVETWLLPVLEERMPAKSTANDSAPTTTEEADEP